MHRVIYNQGDQSLRRIPVDPVTGSPVVLAPGTTVSVSIVDISESETSPARTVSTTTATQDSTRELLLGAAGHSEADPSRVPVSATGLVRGRSYLLEGSGSREVVQFHDLETLSAYATLPLRGRYEDHSGAELQGIELVATFPATEADSENAVKAGGPYLVTWSYTHEGRSIVLADTVYLDRYSLAPPIDEAYVLMAMPPLAQRARARAKPGLAIAVAWQDWLERAESSGRDPALFMPSNALHVALRHRALSYLFQWVTGGDTDESRATKHDGEWDRIVNDLLIGKAAEGSVEIDRVSAKAKDQADGIPFLLRS